MLNEKLEALEARMNETKARMDGLVSLYHMLAASKVTQKKVVFAEIEECAAMIDQFDIAIDAVIDEHLKAAMTA